MFGFGKKALARKMINGVNGIKLVLYKILVDNFSKKYSKRGEDSYKKLTAVVINEIFGCHNNITQPIFNKDKDLIITEIKNIGINYPELKQPITDAIRVYTQANAMLSDNLQKNFKEIFDNAIERGIFIKGGDNPKTDSFLGMVAPLAKQYKITK